MDSLPVDHHSRRTSMDPLPIDRAIEDLLDTLDVPDVAEVSTALGELMLTYSIIHPDMPNVAGHAGCC